MSDFVALRVAASGALACVMLVTGAQGQESSLIAGQNINMVSGTEWPTGDPFLQRQNEPTIAVSTRNELHLMGGSNDYRTVDLPGLPEGRTTGDSWISSYFSYDGGARWTSTLVPGYPQDMSDIGQASPLYQAGYEASADPVIRTGTHGLFYYSGIAFTRGDDAPSAGFVATYMDLNNDERGDTIGYVGTALFDRNDDGSSFIDKPWIAVDKPRGAALTRTLQVNTDDGVVDQTVECGNLYAAYARIQGEATAELRSQIMFTRSEDCGATFSEPLQLTLPNTINQGAAIAVEPNTGRVQVAWRQFENATLSCTNMPAFWRNNPEAWPVDEIELAGLTIGKDDRFRIMDPGRNHPSNTESRRVFRQLLAAMLNALSGADSTAVRDELAEAEAWLLENPIGSRLRGRDKREGRRLRTKLWRFNAGRIGPGNCQKFMGDGSNGMLGGMNPNAILVVHSDDFGETFSEPVNVSGSNYFPFEQGTTEFSFRSTGYPTMTFDGDGRSYIAYTTRGLAVPDFDEVGGDGRIVVATSQDGTDWTFPVPIDEPERPGHQLMPALEFSRGKVFLLYYDFREDVSGVFDRFVVDLPVDPTTPRHSVDVRAAQADAADVPIFTDNSVLDQGSTQTSRYPFLVLSDENDEPTSVQTQYNPPNLPMFRGGLVPFFGDFIDLAALHFVRDELGEWQFDTDSARGVPVVHAVWTDNRDVVAPLDGDWTSYVPPGDGTPRPSIFDPGEMVPVCSANTDPTVIDRTQMRNQNIYTSRLTQGLAVAIPGNNRPLGAIQRVFVGFVQNLTGEDKRFRLEILNQPAGGTASFEQFAFDATIDEVVERNSSVSRSIYVTSTDPTASVDIRVTEIDLAGNPVVGGLTGTTRINPDPSAPAPDDDNILTQEIYTPAIFNPAIFNPAIFNPSLLGTDEVGIFNPAIFNPAIFNDPEQAEFASAALTQLALLNPAIFNPAIFNPAIFNPAIFNPAIFNPAVFNPAIFNPAVFNPAIFNPSTANPAIFNPAIFNPAIFNSSLVETSVVVENNGNATAAYSLNLDLEDPPAGFIYQVMIYRTYLVPTVEGCDLMETVVQEQLVNQLTPDVNGSLLDPESISFNVAPDDFVVATVRVVPDPNNPGNPDDIDTLDELDLSQSVVPQAVDTPSLDDGETEPQPVTVLAPSLPPLIIDAVGLSEGAEGDAYSETLTATGGGGSPLVWSFVPGSSLEGTGLTLTPDGQIVGTPLLGATGVFMFEVRVKDDDQVAEQGFSITINSAAPGGTFDDQAQPNIDPNAGPLAIGDPDAGGQILAQVVTAGLTGLLDEAQLPVACSADSDLILEIRPVTEAGPSNNPGFIAQTVDGALLPPFGSSGPELRSISLSPRVGFGAGAQFAIVLRSTGSCAISQSPPGDTYQGGAGFFDSPPNNPGFIPLTGPALDLPFRTRVESSAFIAGSASPATMEIDSGATFPLQVLLDNQVGLPITSGELRVLIVQPNATRTAARVSLDCEGAPGELLTGDNCFMIFDVSADNSGAGFGTLTPGLATFRTELLDGGTLVHFSEAPVTLTSPQVAAQFWQAEFDLSALSPSGPYACLRNQFIFDLFPTGSQMNIDVQDFLGGPVVGSSFTINGTGGNNVGFEIVFGSPQIADGIGVQQISFTQPVFVESLRVSGQVVCVTPSQSTDFVEATLTPLLDQ